jgi:hypothetical protein
VYNEDGFMTEEMAQALHATSRPKQLRFLGIHYLDSEVLSTAEPTTNLRSAVVQVDSDLIDPSLPHLLNEIPEKRAIEDRHKRLGQMRREWTPPVCKTGCQ